MFESFFSDKRIRIMYLAALDSIHVEFFEQFINHIFFNKSAKFLPRAISTMQTHVAVASIGLEFSDSYNRNFLNLV